MAETQSKTQLPMGVLMQSRSKEDAARALERGLRFGRQYAQQAVRRFAAWAEENPGSLLLAGVAAGFLLGKLLPGPLRRVAED